MTSGAIPPFDQYQMPGSPPDSGPVIGGLNTTQVNDLILANNQLGALSGPVNQLIQAAVQNLVLKGSSINNLDTTGLLNTLTADSIIDPATGLSVSVEVQQLRNLLGGTAASSTPPTITSAPTLTFPGGTGDKGETATIVPGSLGGGTSTGVTYQITSESTPQGSAGVSLVVPLQDAWFVTATRTIFVTQIVSWAGGPPITRSSIAYTLNTPPAVPAMITPPSWGAVTPQVGATIPVNPGTSTNSRLSLVMNVYRGYAGISNPGQFITALTAAGSYTIQAADAGLVVAIIEVDTNAAGSSAITANSVSSVLVVPSSAGAPQWVDPNFVPLAGAILPSSPVSVVAVGDTITPDLGVMIGNANPTGYSIQYARDGNPAGMPSASGVMNLPYVTLPADAGHIISFTTTNTNAGGTSRVVTSAGVLVTGAATGGGSTGLLSGSVTQNIASGTSVTISTVGVKDWIEIPTDFSSPVTKSGGPARLTVAVSAGTASSGSTSNTDNTIVWTGGTPTATGSVKTGAFVFGVGGEVTLTLTGVSTTQETLTVYYWTNTGETNTVTASLSDGSASNFAFNGQPGYRASITLTFKAASAGQSLTVKINNVTGGQPLCFQGAALA